jgi:hypothetical protein
MYKKRLSWVAAGKMMLGMRPLPKILVIIKHGKLKIGLGV